MDSRKWFRNEIKGEKMEDPRGNVGIWLMRLIRGLATPLCLPAGGDEYIIRKGIQPKGNRNLEQLTTGNTHMEWRPH